MTTAIGDLFTGLTLKVNCHLYNQNFSFIIAEWHLEK